MLSFLGANSQARTAWTAAGVGSSFRRSYSDQAVSINRRHKHLATDDVVAAADAGSSLAGAAVSMTGPWNMGDTDWPVALGDFDAHYTTTPSFVSTSHHQWTATHGDYIKEVPTPQPVIGDTQLACTCMHLYGRCLRTFDPAARVLLRSFTEVMRNVVRMSKRLAVAVGPGATPHHHPLLLLRPVTVPPAEPHCWLVGAQSYSPLDLTLLKCTATGFADLDVTARLAVVSGSLVFVTMTQIVLQLVDAGSAADAWSLQLVTDYTVTASGLHFAMPIAWLDLEDHAAAAAVRSDDDSATAADTALAHFLGAVNGKSTKPTVRSAPRTARRPGRGAGLAVVVCMFLGACACE